MGYEWVGGGRGDGKEVEEVSVAEIGGRVEEETCGGEREPGGVGGWSRRYKFHGSPSRAKWTRMEN